MYAYMYGPKIVVRWRPGTIDYCEWLQRLANKDWYIANHSKISRTIETVYGKTSFIEYISIIIHLETEFVEPF